MKTILIELRYHSEPESHEPYHGLVDGINDIVGILASRFSLDILSISHIIEDRPGRHTIITCTAVCALNRKWTKEQIGKILEEENHRENNNLYCFLDAHDKLSVRAEKISYN